jgi:hypothetical protein
VPEIITVSLDVRLSSGPAWAVSRQIAVDAVDVVNVVIEHGAADFEVPIQPGGAVRLILLAPDPPNEELTYQTSAGGAETYALDQPHLLLGTGGVGMLEGADPPTKLFFSKAGTTDAGVTILVGRDIGA